jgi:ABC-2 type transport system ATP-binding protein
MDNDIVIQSISVSKKYGKLEVLKNVSFNIAKGEIFVFLGPNGAGKTTTVKILAGILNADSGEVRILSKKMFPDNVELKKFIGYLPDEPYIYNLLTGREFLSFISSIYKINFEEQKFDYYLSQLELKDVIDKLISSYSKGMKQKLLLMSIFLREPEIYILDEPLIGLDPQSISYLKKYIKEKSFLGKTIILATHLLDLAESLATRLAIIYNGEIIVSGSKTELIQNLNLSKDATLEQIYLTATKSEKIL